MRTFWRLRGLREPESSTAPVSMLNSMERERGFTTSLLERGAVLVAKEYGDYTIESGHACMRRIAERGLPDAVFCANDYMAAGALRYLRSIGVSVPRTIAVVGYDNNDIAIATDPPLTTVDNRFFDLGQVLAEEVISLICGEHRRVQRLVLPELKLRQSHLFGGNSGAGARTSSNSRVRSK